MGGAPVLTLIILGIKELLLPEIIEITGKPVHAMNNNYVTFTDKLH